MTAARRPPLVAVDPNDWTPDESGDRIQAADESSPDRPDDGQPWSDADGCRRLPAVPKGELGELPRWLRSLAWTEKLDKQTEEILCRPASNVSNAVKILRQDWRWRGVLAIDDMAKQMTTAQIAPWHEYERATRGGAWDPDADPTRLAIWMFDAYGMNLSKERVSDAALVVAQDRRFHPVHEWLKSLPSHDCQPRVDGFFPRYFGAPDNEYTRAVGRVFLLSLVARAVSPGCKVDTVVVIEGPQGIRKSTACKALVGERWFAENTCEVGTKDAQLAMHGKWLLEMPELAGLTRAQIEPTKAFFSRSSDWLRPPYAKGYQELRRSSVPVATTNDSQYLRDRTGNRRYLPIACGTRIDVEGIERDRPGLFAEAFARYSAGERYHLADTSTLDLANLQTQRRETVDPWEEILAPWLHESTALGVRGAVGVTVLEAFEKLAVPTERKGPESSVRIGAIFRRAKLELTRARDRKAERDAAERGVPYVRPRIYMWPNVDAEPVE